MSDLTEKFGPRVNSITGQPMFEGYCIDDGEFYCETDAELVEIMCDKYGFDPPVDLERWKEQLYESKRYYWTEWREEPLEDWHKPPSHLQLLVGLLDWIDQNVDEMIDPTDLESDTQPVVHYDRMKGEIYTLIQAFNLGKWKA